MTQVDPTRPQTLTIAVLTVSNRRTAQDDSAGDYLVDRLTAVGHRCLHRQIVPDNIYAIRRVLSDWIADDSIHVILTTGGTGFSEQNVLPEAASVLFDKTVEGFGELFRQISYASIGAAAIQSRALAGYANRTIIFCMPGALDACQTAWEHLIRDQLDSGQKPCNFASKVGPAITRQDAKK